MKIAALYWPTSSVGGINTELRAFHAEAEQRGDTFHVLRSGNLRNVSHGLFKERKTIRGGDTFITIDGEASHHQDRVKATAEWINANYDRVYLAFLCPHPTKAYGQHPWFLRLLELIKLPIVGRITDGYWDSYAEWGEKTLALCERATFVHSASAEYWAGRKRVHHVPAPFFPALTYAQRSVLLSTCWISQWKAIKGIHKLLPHIPKIPGAVDLYSNGILYYQLRSTPAWVTAVRKDHFKGYNGNGHADFHGYVPLDSIPDILARSWFMIDLMGIGRPRNSTYQKGAHNLTTIEAAWYGACPILHASASNVVPLDIALFVRNAERVPGLIADRASQKFALDPERRKRAQRWVRENFWADRAYNLSVLGDAP